MQANQTTTKRDPDMRGRVIETIKAKVPIEQVAPEYGEFKLQGNGRLLGRCVAVDHTDRTPSMTLFTDTQRFKCFGCGLAGDVIDLEEIAGRHLDPWTAVIALSERYGVALPERSKRWHERQDEKAQTRAVVKEHFARKYQIRLTRLYKPLVLTGGESPEEEFQELQELAAALWPICLDLAGKRVSDEE